jgi:hypothetical protein
VSVRALVTAAAFALAAVPAASAGTTFTVAPAGLTDGQTVSGVVQIQAALDGAPAQRVEFSIDGRLRAVAQSAPFAFAWDTSQELNGPHTIELWAVAADGTVASAEITVVVSNTFQLALGGIADGQQLQGTVHVTPQVTGLGAQWLEVLVDGELRATLTRLPYAFDWNTALETAGPHRLTIWGVAVGGAVSQVSVQIVVGAGQAADRQTLVAKTLDFRAQTWALQQLMRVPRTPSAAPSGTLAELVLWRSRAAAARLQASHPAHFDDWMCIHSHEAGWTNHDTGHNGHYGGLQMSFDFMRGYAPELYAAKGTADRWTPLEQMWVAERAWASGRGFHPWPETAHMCGLV